MAGDDRLTTVCLCCCGLLFIICGATMIALGIDYSSNLASHSNEWQESVIQEFYSFYCTCHDDNCIDDSHQQYKQYMYTATSNETCGNQTIKSVKDECKIQSKKPVPFSIGSHLYCHITDCNGLFRFVSENEITQFLDSQIYVGLGISSMIVAGFCCIAGLISGSNNCCRFESNG